MTDLLARFRALATALFLQVKLLLVGCKRWALLLGWTRPSKAQAQARVAAQQALLQAAQARQLRLENELDLCNQALLEASIAAAEAACARRDLLTRMGHDLRAPLTTVMGYADLIAHRDGRWRPPLSGLQRSAKQMLALIDGLMACSHGSVQAEPLTPQPLYLADFLAAVAACAATAAKQNGNRFDYRAARELPDVVVADAKRLRQVLAHLLANAAAFTSGGEVELRVDCLAGASADRPLSFVFTIRDTGPGMTQDQVRTIFEPWQALEFSPKAAFWGRGLAVTRQWVQRMGGHIEAVSGAGLGTVMRVTVPLKLASEQEISVGHLVSEAQAAQPLHGAGRFLWIVDDSPAICNLLGRHLERQGFTVLTLSCGQDAVDRIGPVAEPVPDLILTDLKMVGAGGRAVLARARATWPEVPVVLMTSAPELVAGDGHGFSAVLAKPLRMALLHRTLDRLLDISDTPQAGAGA